LNALERQLAWRKPGTVEYEQSTRTSTVRAGAAPPWWAPENSPAIHAAAARRWPLTSTRRLVPGKSALARRFRVSATAVGRADSVRRTTLMSSSAMSLEWVGLDKSASWARMSRYLGEGWEGGGGGGGDRVVVVRW